MRTLGLWESDSPTAEALASTTPFCIDTLTFHQWVQFVFVVRIKHIIETGGSLPTSSDIVPIAEEHFSARECDGSQVIGLFRQFDQFIAE